MISFLEHIANEILKNGKDEFSNITIIFPSRRAGLYFRNILSNKINSPVWSPVILSIEDYFKKLSPYTIADKLLLIFELHKIHKEKESFDKFYSWGEMLLKDFDEVDKYLIPADILFRKVKDFKEIEEAFPIELQEDFKKFWATIFNTNKTPLKEEFKKIWENMSGLYTGFRESLKSQGIAYEGMAHREICERMINGEIKIDSNKIIFAGFNSLNKCEEKIINKLLEDGNAEIYWDCDEYYIKDEKQEAGNFLRKNFKNFNIKKPGLIGNNLLTDNKNLKITGIPLSTGQAKLAGMLIKELSVSENFNPDKTVIVLPDENLLLPVLYSLPDNIKDLNITMGFKFRNTPLYNLILLIKSLQENKKKSGKELRFYHKDVISLLMHPYLKIFNSEYNFEIIRGITKDSYVYVPAKNIIKPEAPVIIGLLFSEPGEINGIFKYLRNIIDLVAAKFEEKQSAYENFQREYIYSLYLQLNRLEDILNKYKTAISREIFWEILVDILKTISIPFTGEPLKGLQIMGLLETRAIDFENIFILSVNEKILPKGNSHNSFIPYPLRKAMKMPVYQDNDSVDAYYFYRLLQRAKNINLIYNTESDENTAGISRFLLQVEYELAKQNPGINFSHKVAAADVVFMKKKEIRITKSEEIIEKLNELQKLSASAIKSYINCSLQFYFKKIAGLREENNLEEILDPADLGNLFHKVMEILYKPFENKLIGLEELVTIQKILDEQYDDIFRESLNAVRKTNIDINLQGRNYLTKTIIKKLAEKVIEKDKEYVPITIKGLEIQIENKINVNADTEIILTGKIDRMEQKDDIYRIIDYKTSDSQLKKPQKNQTKEDYFESFITNSKYNDTFQAFYYSYLFYKTNSDVKVNPALYIVRRASEGMQFLKDNYLTEEDIKTFEEKLLKLFKDLFNKEIDFTQTEDEDNCRYCEFRNLCYRE